jgi:hypothetical protein
MNTIVDSIGELADVSCHTADLFMIQILQKIATYVIFFTQNPCSD